MNWKLVLAVASTGLVMGALSLVGWTQHRETALWGIIAVASAVVLGRAAPRAPFLHGFWAGMIAGSLGPFIQFLFFPLYLGANLDTAAQMRELPTAWNPRIVVLALTPALGALSGLVFGFLTWLVSLVLRRRPAAA